MIVRVRLSGVLVVFPKLAMVKMIRILTRMTSHLQLIMPGLRLLEAVDGRPHLGRGLAQGVPLLLQGVDGGDILQSRDGRDQFFENEAIRGEKWTEK